jgi:hypothetical protein
MGQMRNVRKISFGKPEAKRALGRCRRRWKDEVKMDFKERRCQCVAWTRLAYVRVSWRVLLNMVIKLRD